MAIQPYIIPKSRKTSLLRYEVYNKSMIRSFVLSSDYNIGKFPFLAESEIFNYKKEALFCAPGSPSKSKEAHEKSKSSLASREIPLNQIPNSELMKYFSISTDTEDPKVTIMRCRPSVYPHAEQMAQDIARAFELNYIRKDLDVKYWLIDFVESVDGILYFLQVKSFKIDVLHEERRSHQKQLRLKLLSKQNLQKKYNSRDKLKGMTCRCNLFCDAFENSKSDKPFELVHQISVYLNTILRPGILLFLNFNHF